MVDQGDWELLLRLVLAFVAGALVGVERERRNKPAGLRTHMLVAGGSAMFTLASLTMAADAGQGRDPTRIAAQIVTGVGFLGAGAIFRSGSDIVGLTTAATIWVAAALGVLCGGGNSLLAISATVLSVIVLLLPGDWPSRRGTGPDQDSPSPAAEPAAEEERPRRTGVAPWRTQQ
jgi:putative Mg2+ transporter-C (MgtC) family protein